LALVGPLDPWLAQGGDLAAVTALTAQVQAGLVGAIDAALEDSIQAAF